MQKIFCHTGFRALRSPCCSQVVKNARKFHLPPLSSKNSPSKNNTTESNEDSSDSVTPLSRGNKDDVSENQFAAQLEALYQARKAARIAEDAGQTATTESAEVTDKSVRETQVDEQPKDGKPSLHDAKDTKESKEESKNDRGVIRYGGPRKKDQAGFFVVTKRVTEEFDVMMSAYRKDMASAETKTLNDIIVQDIHARQTGKIRIISLNRTKSHNALSTALLRELKDEISLIHAEGDKGPTRCVIIASTSPVSFCAGADLKERLGMTTEAVKEYLVLLRETFRLIHNLPVPCIAAVDGNALGGGAELALCAHIRVLGANASIALPETKLGIIPGAGGTYRLADIVGQAKALEMILTRKRVNATLADEVGLGKYTDYQRKEDQHLKLDQTALHEACLARSVSMALAITNAAPLAVRAVIQAMVRKDRPSGEVEENMAYESLLETSDRKEALQAFAEKRWPEFKGE